MAQRSIQSDSIWREAVESIHPVNFCKIPDLLSSPEAFFMVFTHFPGIMVLSTMEGIIVEVNEGFIEAIGFGREEVIGANAVDLIWKRRKDRVRFLKNLREQGSVKKMEAPFRKKDGEFIGAISAVRFQLANEVYILSSTEDITTHIEAQAILEKYSAVFRGVLDVILIADHKGRIVEANDTALKVYGYSREEFLSLNIKDLRSVEEKMPAALQIMEANQKGALYEAWHRTREGRVFPVETSLAWVAVRKQRFLLGVIRDISERKQVEEQRRRDAEEIMDLYNNAPCGYHSLDRNGVYVKINDTELKWLGYSREEVLGRKITEFLSADSMERFNRGIGDFIERGEITDVELDFIRKDGSILPVLLNSAAVKDARGNFLMSRAIMINIEERKMAEEARRKDAQQIFDLYNNAPCGYVSADRDNVIVKVNDTLLNWLGYSREEVVGKAKLADFVTGKSREYYFEKAPYFREKGEAMNLEFEIKRKDGSTMIVLVNVKSMLDARGNYLMSNATLTDITDRRKMEEAARKSEKKYRLIFENAIEGIFQVLPNRRYTKVNPACAAMFGYDTPEEMMAAVGDIYDTYADRQEALRLTDILLKRGFVRDYVAERIRKDGAAFWTSINASVVYDKKGDVKLVEGSYIDITKRIQYLQELEYINQHDPLTGLYNRKYFENVLNSPASAKINAILICDIDGLKLVNDSIGHWAGDDLLAAAGEVLKNCFKENEIIARVGGDEFAVLMSGVNAKFLNKAARQIKLACEAYNAGKPLIPLSLSVGVAYREDATDDVYKLIKQADDNMYRQKLRSGRSARSAIVKILTKTMEERDFGTQNHAYRLTELMRIFALRLDFPAWQIEELVLFSQFHDIGKVGIPDKILFKPGPLDDEEKFEMQKHSEIGYRIAQASADLAAISELILKHHEWWNGQGYPLGLKKEEIPIGCRMLTIVDAYDAMTSDRPYRKAMTHEEAVGELLACSGRQFDPSLVKVFLECVGSIHE